MSSQVLRDLTLSLDSHRALRERAQRCRSLELARLAHVRRACRLLTSMDANNNAFFDDFSDASSLALSSRHTSSESSQEARAPSTESLRALQLEESLLRAEITHLTSGDASDDTDDDDDDLKEFRRIEREIKVSELNKSLELIESQISAKEEALRARADRPSAPLAEAESLTTEESPPRDDARDDAARRPDDDRRQRRPLTLYMPNESDELDLAAHLRELGHEPERDLVHVTRTTCSGYLLKLCRNSESTWRKRFFVFDRNSKAFVYFRSRALRHKSRAPQGGAPFDHILDVYVDHTRSSAARHVFVVSTRDRLYVLASARAEVMRIWVDALVTGARGNCNWIS